MLIGVLDHIYNFSIYVVDISLHIIVEPVVLLIRKMSNIENPQASVLVTYRQGYLHKKENEKKVIFAQSLLFENNSI